MKFKFIIVYDEVTGTNDPKIAEYWSKCDDAVVIDCETGEVLQTYPEEKRVAIGEETHDGSQDTVETKN